MLLSPAQRTTFKNHILANTNTIQVEADPPIAINVCPGIAGDPTYRNAIRDWYNGLADYRVHRSNVTRVEIYKTTVLAADSSTAADTTWDWSGYKGQTQGEQDSWKEMFMGGSCDFGNLNNRQGCHSIFGASGAGGANKVHIFNVARRKCTNFERLYSVVSAVGNPATGTGNVLANPRGSVTNPDTLGIGADFLPISGAITQANVSDALDNG